jgi:hypothetical protein
MAITPLPKPLEVQLKLEGKGVLVAHVRKGSAADKAGVQDNDIVLMVDEAPVKEPKDLIVTVEEAPEKERTLTLLRRGETITVTVTPARPPEEHEADDEDDQRFKLEGDQLRINISELRDLEKILRDKLRNAGVDMRMHIIEPGAFLPRGADFSFGRRTGLPDDISITIRKQGKKPADIEVKKGEESWTVKEDDLAPLPDEVRGAVEGYLGHTPMRFQVVGDEHGFTFGGPYPPGEEGHGPRPPDGPDGPPRGPGDVEFAPPHHGPEGPDGPEARRGPRPQRRGPDGPVGPPEGPGAERFGADERGRIGGGLERRLEEMARRMEDMQRQLEGLRHHLDAERGDRPERARRPARPEPHEEPAETESDES